MNGATSAALQKARLHILPILFAGYAFSILDRANINVAAVTMNSDLGITAFAFGLATAAFGIGYLVFEVPSNLMLARFGARLWLARIMFTWGLATTAMLMVAGVQSLVLLRSVVGAAEAGFLSGVVFYLASWFPASHRARVTADFMLAIPVISGVGAILSASFLNFNGALGLRGWQWVFLLEGIPPVLLSIWMLNYLPDGLQNARFLNAAEKRTIEEALQQDRPQGDTRVRADSFRSLIADPLIWALGLSNFGFIICLYAIATWLPLILKTFGFATFTIGIITSIPNFVGAVGMILWSMARGPWARGIYSVLTPVIFGGLALLVGVAFIDLPMIAVTAISLAGGALYAAIPTFWTMAAGVTQGRKAAAGLAIINTLGSLSGVIGAPIVGFLRDMTASYQGGLYLICSFLILPIGLLVFYRRRLPGT